jgi:tetratricopeptide (TPR) repeat protein
LTRAERDRDEMGLLLSLWEWERAFDYPAIRDALEPLPRAEVLGNEELSLQLLYAYLYLRDLAMAMALAVELRPVFAPSRNDRNYRRFLNAYAHLVQLSGGLAEGQALVEELQEKAQDAGDERHAFHAALQLGVITGLQGDFVQSVRHGYHALALSDTLDGGRWTSILHHNLGISYRELGLIAEAQRHFEQSARHPRPDWMAATGDLDRALLLHVVGDFETAAGLARNSLATFQRVESRAGMAEAHLVLARVALGQRDVDEAAAQLDRLMELLDPSEVLIRAQAQEELAVLHLLRGDPAGRAEAERTADGLYRGMEAPWRAERMRMRLQILDSATASADADARAEYWASTPGL